MVSALHSSGGLRTFAKMVSLLVVDMWERDIKRTADGKLSHLSGMQQRYITRDCWTKLNVKPAKIMQVHAP